MNEPKITLTEKTEQTVKTAIESMVTTLKKIGSLEKDAAKLYASAVKAVAKSRKIRIKDITPKLVSEVTVSWVKPVLMEELGWSKSVATVRLSQLKELAGLPKDVSRRNSNAGPVVVDQAEKTDETEKTEKTEKQIDSISLTVKDDKLFEVKLDGSEDGELKYILSWLIVRDEAGFNLALQEAQDLVRKQLEAKELAAKIRNKGKKIA